MAYIVPSRAETLADRALYTRDRLVELPCLDCNARVKVRKNSEHHTSIQWTMESRAQCPELSRRTGGRDVHLGCPRMVASIEDAAREGRIPIGAEDGY